MLSPKTRRQRENLLGRHLLLETRDVDEAASFLSTAAVPYRSELLVPGSAFFTQIFGAQSPRMHLSLVRTTGAMRVHAQLPDDDYAMVLATSGEVCHRVQGEEIRVSAESGLLQSPLQAVEARTPEHFELLFLRFSRESLVQEFKKILDRELTAPLAFSPHFVIGTAAGQRFHQMALKLCRLLNQDDGLTGEHGLALHSAENHLLSLLLTGQRHNYTRVVARFHNAGPWQVRATEEYIAANAHLPLSLGDLCAASGVCVRTLQHSFRAKRGCSPMQFLRQVRLERAHLDLSQTHAGPTVTEIASRWGFLHFGRFAREYRTKFGENPSETLKRARTVSRRLSPRVC